MFLPWNFLCTQWFKCFTFARSYTFRIRIKSIYRKFWSNPYQNSDKIQQKPVQNTSTTSFKFRLRERQVKASGWLKGWASRVVVLTLAKKIAGSCWKGKLELPCSALGWKLPKSSKEFSFFSVNDTMATHYLYYLLLYISQVSGRLLLKQNTQSRTPEK